MIYRCKILHRSGRQSLVRSLHHHLQNTKAVCHITSDYYLRYVYSLLKIYLKTFKLVHCIDETRNCATEFTEKT